MQISILQAEQFVEELSKLDFSVDLTATVGKDTDALLEILSANTRLIRELDRHQKIANAIHCLQFAINAAVWVADVEAELRIRRLNVAKVKKVLHDSVYKIVVDSCQGVKEVQALLSEGESHSFYAVTAGTLQGLAQLHQEEEDAIASLSASLAARKAEELVELPEDIVDVLVEEKLLTA